MPVRVEVKYHCTAHNRTPNNCTNVNGDGWLGDLSKKIYCTEKQTKHNKKISIKKEIKSCTTQRVWRVACETQSVYHLHLDKWHWQLEITTLSK